MQENLSQVAIEPKQTEPKQPATSPGRRKTYLYIILAVAIGLVTNIFIGLLVDADKLRRVFAQVSWDLVAVPFLIYLFLSFVDAIRLKMVGWKCGYILPFRACLSNSIVGSFFSNVTPMAAGGQPFQVFHLQKYGMPGKIATNIILSRFVVNAMILMGILLIAIPTIVRIANTVASAALVFYLGLGLTFLFALTFLAILIQPKIVFWLSKALGRGPINRLIVKLSKRVEWQADLEKATQELRSEIRSLWSKGRSVMILDIVLNIGVIVMQGLALWYPLQRLSEVAVPFFPVLITFVVVWQVVFYIPSPGASGGLEGMFVLVFTAFFGNDAAMLTGIIMWRAGSYYLHLILGLVVSTVSIGRVKTPSKKTEQKISDNLNEKL